ncbi:uncharacterized protein TNCV_2749181 [Trichonephila clavipes]|nr:uncharacterized protein TNCV_2749181 [Trichonephila clavipes]
MEVIQAIVNVLVSKGEQVQTRSADQYAVAQSVVVEKEKEEISVDVIKDKDDLKPVILSKEKIDFDEDEIKEKPKLPKRKRKNLSRMTAAELQQKGNLKVSSNMVLIPQHWSFRGEHSQDKSGMGKLAWKLTDFIKRDGLAWKLTDFIKRDGTVKIRRSSQESRMIRQRFRFKLRTHDNIYRDGKILDYVEVRNPQTTSNLLQILNKYEEQFLDRKIRGSSWESRDIKPNKNNRFPNRNRQENWRETRGNNRYADNSRPRREFNRFESKGVDNQRFDGQRRGGQSDHRFRNQGGRQGASRNSTFRGQRE